MLSKFWGILAFIGAALAGLIVWVKKSIKTTAAHEDAKAGAQAAGEDVKEKKSAVQVTETEHAVVSESVERRLALLEEKDREARQKDSVALANDIIKGA